jgi:SAM-dependent methyltransferase
MKKISAKENKWMRNQLAGTNGRHYGDQINTITFYPHYSLPIPKTYKENALMLEVGAGWGRWLVSGFEKGYIPVGIDLKLSHIESVFKTMDDHGKYAYMVLTDLSNLPFKPGVFDLVWSFSSIQHVHFDKAISCLEHINRILKSDGFTLLEFPNKNGIHNKRGPVQSQEPYRYEPEGLMVRYYTIKEYYQMMKIFSTVRVKMHSLLGIGVLPEDLKYVTWKKKPLVAASLAATAISKLIPGTNEFADSLYFECRRSGPVEPPASMQNFLSAHKRGYNNLNIVHLMQCPYTGGELVLHDNYLISPKAGVKFPILQNVPHIRKDFQESL